MNKTSTFRIYNSLKNNKMSAKNLSVRLGINYNTVRKILGQLIAQKHIKRIGYTKTGGLTLYTARAI